MLESERLEVKDEVSIRFNAGPGQNLAKIAVFTTPQIFYNSTMNDLMIELSP